MIPGTRRNRLIELAVGRGPYYAPAILFFQPEELADDGRFFVWIPAEIHAVLGEEADAFMAAYGVTRHGNCEGRKILESAGDMDQRPTLSEARRSLFQTQEKRVHPGRNDVQLAQAPTAQQGLSPCPGPDLLERPDASHLGRRGAGSAAQ